jgi:hypothetical protein
LRSESRQAGEQQRPDEDLGSSGATEGETVDDEPAERPPPSMTIAPIAAAAMTCTNASRIDYERAQARATTDMTDAQAA